jgi:hypothetical protein
MQKHLVPLLHVGVHRDITATVNVQVPEHEIAILQSVHGDSNVYPGEPTGTETALDVATEHDRLVRKYGDDPVRDAYGATAKGDIRRLVLAASTGTVEDKGYGVELEGPDSPPVKLSLPASEVQRPAPKPKGREAATA